MIRSHRTKKVKHPPIKMIKTLSEIYQKPIINSHKKFSNVFDEFTINRLNAWFKNNGKVTEFVREERRRRGLDEINTIVESDVYGTINEKSSLILVIKKHGIDFIHLSIHLAPDFLKTTMKK